MQSMRLHTRPCNHKASSCKCYNFEDPRWNELLHEAAGDEGWTLERIGEVMGSSRMSICTQEKRILDKVRKALKNKNITGNDI